MAKQIEDLQARLAIRSDKPKAGTGIVDILMGASDSEPESKITMLPLKQIHPLHSFQHPYEKSINEGLDELTEQIRAVGILQPLVVRLDTDHEGEYEVIIGHRRRLAALQAGLGSVPVMIRDLSDAEAKIVVSDNLNQREKIYPSEKALAYELMIDGLKQQGKRRDLTETIEHFRQTMPKVEENSARGIVAASEGISVRQVSNYLRLNSLIPELMNLVDQLVETNGKEGISISAGAELSFLPAIIQEWIALAMRSSKCKLTNQIVAALRTADQNGLLTCQEMVEAIICPDEDDEGVKKKRIKPAYQAILKKVEKKYFKTLAPEKLELLSDESVCEALQEEIRKTIEKFMEQTCRSKEV